VLRKINLEAELLAVISEKLHYFEKDTGLHVKDILIHSMTFGSVGEKARSLVTKVECVVML
jgi:hypothetical protein